MTETVKISEPGGILAAVPHILGFVPDEGVAVIGLADKRIMATIWLRPETLDAVSSIWTAFAMKQVDACVIISYSADLGHAAARGGFVVLDTPIEIDEQIIVVGDRYQSYDCGCRECQVGGVGHPVPDHRDSPLGAPTVSLGIPVKQTRAEIMAEFVPGSAEPDYGTEQQLLRVGNLSDRDKFTGELVRMSPEELRQAAADLTRAACAHSNPDLYSLAAVAWYCVGDGLRVNGAVDAAHEIDPTHSFSTLIAQAIGVGLPNDEFRNLLVLATTE